jgi:excisionase family DNA binding protein
MNPNEEESHMSTIASPRLLRAKEVAQILGVDPKRVRELVATGDLPSVRLGGAGWHRFRIEDIEHLIAGEDRAAP